MNNQKPEGPRIDDGLLDVHSFFYTIQGEGPFAGHRAVFVRLAGCNLQCPGCDTEYTEGRTFMKPEVVALTVDSMVTVERDKGAFLGDNPLVVITGGEPLRQQIGWLVAILLDYGFRVQIESNGFFAPDDKLRRLLGYVGAGSQWQRRLSLVVSPKTGKISQEARASATAFKYVIDADSLDPNDGLPIHALSHPGNKVVARPLRMDVPIYVNPCDRGDPVINQRNLEAAAWSAMKFGYILGVQIHKLVGVA